MNNLQATLHVFLVASCVGWFLYFYIYKMEESRKETTLEGSNRVLIESLAFLISVYPSMLYLLGYYLS